MKGTRSIPALMLLGLIIPAVCAQEPKSAQTTPSESASAQPETALKVQVVISEYNGTQKVSSLPYTLFLVEQSDRSKWNQGSLRLDANVPVPAGTYNETSTGPVVNTTYQMMSVGTDIDCHLVPEPASDSRYHLTFTIHRTSLVPSAEGADMKQLQTATGRPIVRTFQDSFDVLLRDGQTVEASSSVDPTTGNVMKVEITLNVEK
jgi:hypothetical protein